MKAVSISPHDLEVATELRNRLAARVPMRRLVVFGSRARGDHDPDSDMDVLVVLEDSATMSDRRTISDIAWDISIEHGILITPIVYSRHDWEEGPERSSLLALAIANEGVEVDKLLSAPDGNTNLQE